MEEELKLMERQNGVDVEYMRPEPCFCIKVKSKQHGKIFVNICKSPQVETARAVKSKSKDGRSGVSWNVPHKYSPARTCLDKEGTESKEHDVTFHCDTLELAAKSPAFKDMLIDAALETILSTFNYSFKRSEYKILVNVKSKSTPATLVVSKKKLGESSNDTNKSEETISNPAGSTELAANAPVETPRPPKITEISSEEAHVDKITENIAEIIISTVEPEYKILYRDIVDIKRSDDPDVKSQTLVVKIELPKVETFKELDLDVHEKQILLTYRNVYKLDLDLPVLVDTEAPENKCLFHKDRKQLELVLKMLVTK